MKDDVSDSHPRVTCFPHDQRMARHLMRLFDTHYIKQCRGDVGETSAVDPYGTIGARDDDGNIKRRVRGVRFARFRIPHHFRIAMI